MIRLKHTFRLRPDLAASLADYGRRHRCSQAAVVEAALTGLFAREADGQPESALLRRLDRITRQIGLTRWHVELGNEAVAQFIRAGSRPISRRRYQRTLHNRPPITSAGANLSRRWRSRWRAGVGRAR